MNQACPDIVAKIVPAIADIGRDVWDACANTDPASFNPFISYDFLNALETSGCVGPSETGWLVQHIALEDGNGETIACLPCYAKLHSHGEYVFDHAWANAYHRAGGRYYPKLLSAVPFTPVPGPRLLVRPDQDLDKTQALIARALIQLCERLDASSVHITFVNEPAWRGLSEHGFVKRIDQQFHWHNRGYTCFEDFLDTLSSRKRKTIRKERRLAQQSGLKIHSLTGAQISESDWDCFFDFYIETGSRKWGQPYLNRAFFSELGRSLADRCLMVLAKNDGTPVAGALHLIGGDALYGRYWGALDYHPFLHFELCYYQAIEYAIKHGLGRVEAGAQGEHKLLRGYVPTPTYSAHWFRDSGFMKAIDTYLKVERRDVADTSALLTRFSPYKIPAKAK